MPRTISDEEWNYLQAQDKAANFANSFLTNPKFAPRVKAIIKEAHPDLEIPGYDDQRAVQAMIEKDKQEREEEKRKEAQAKQDAEIQAKRSKTQKDYGFTEEAMVDLEKMMVERNIGDYEVAATYHASKNPKVSDATYDSTRWHHDRQDGFAEISKDPEGYARDQIMGAMLRDQRRMRDGG